MAEVCTICHEDMAREEEHCPTCQQRIEDRQLQYHRAHVSDEQLVEHIMYLEAENQRLKKDKIQITQEEAPHVLLAIVSCIDDSLYLDSETEAALISVYDKIQQMFSEKGEEG